MSNEDIKDELDSRRNDFAILAQNVRQDANIGVLSRAANAFLAKEVIFYGARKFNRSAAVGTHNYETLRFFHDKYKLFQYIKEQGYVVICAELTDDAKSIVDFQYPPNSLIVLGNEGDGIYDSFLQQAHAKLFIPMLGSVRSLNVGVTGTIFMYDWVQKAAKKGSLILPSN